MEVVDTRGSHGDERQRRKSVAGVFGKRCSRRVDVLQSLQTCARSIGYTIDLSGIGNKMLE